VTNDRSPDAAVARVEVLTPQPAEALGGLLGVPTPAAADGLPPLWHWIYLLDRPAQTDLGVDGHPVRGTVPTPPAPGLRRMWAGGRVRTLDRLKFGEPATRHTAVLSTERKTGRSGELIFVTVGHRVSQRGTLVVDERQDLVYRAPAPPAPRQPGRAPDEDGVPGWRLDTSPTLLFRFSALTYNSHRIHYDRDYARSVEGYPGLLVHGPLQAIAMAEAVRALGALPARSDFDYRLVAPLFDNQGMVVFAAADGALARASVRDATGRTTASATMTPLD
jgi:3-methylfumaryl-CoA hydratase